VSITPHLLVLFIDRNLQPNDLSMGCLVFTFNVGIYSESFPWSVCFVQEICKWNVLPFFGHVGCGWCTV